MLRKYTLSFFAFMLALVILAISVLQSASVPYALATQAPSKAAAQEPQMEDIIYGFPFPGKVQPDSPFWSLKAIRDKVVFVFTLKPLKKAELALLFSDKRLMLSKMLFENNKPDLGISTLTKGEKYLEIAVNEESIARTKGVDTNSFLIKLATASLKHRQVIEGMMNLVPEDVKPSVVKSEDYSKNAYKHSRDALNSKGIVAPKDPFDGL